MCGICGIYNYGTGVPAERQLLDAMVSGLIEGAQAAAAAAKVRSVEDVRLCPRRLAVLTEAARLAGRQLKSFLHERVYTAPGLLEEKERCAEKVTGLFRFYLDFREKLPAGYRERAEQEPLHRVICDYIAGMTDNFLARVHQEHLRN